MSDSQSSYPTLNCDYLLDDGGCDLGQKDGCVCTTEDQKCGFVVHSSPTIARDEE